MSDLSDAIGLGVTTMVGLSVANMAINQMSKIGKMPKQRRRKR